MTEVIANPSLLGESSLIQNESLVVHNNKTNESSISRNPIDNDAALEQAHALLPDKYAKGLLQDLLIVKIAKTDIISKDPYLSYNNDDTFCLRPYMLKDLSQDLTKIAYYTYKNPEDHNDYICIVNNLNNQLLNFDRGNGSVTLTFPANNLQTNKINLAVAPNQPVFSENSIYSSILGYQLFQQQAASNNTQYSALGGNFTNTVTTPVGSLINAFSAGTSNTANTLNRASTFWQMDYPQSMTSAVVGDATAQPATYWGGSANYAGLQYGSNVLLRPQANFQAQNPELIGVVDNPSTLSFATPSGNLASPVALNAGPYDISNIPTPNGQGNLMVNFRTESGAIYQTLNIPYYNNANLLAKDTYLYQYNIGLPNSNAGTGLNTNYNTNQAIFSTNHQYGFTNSYTGTLHAEAYQGYFANLGLTHSLNLLDQFYTGITTSVSQAQTGTGTFVGWTFAREPSSANSIGFTYNLGQTDAEFATLSAPNGFGYEQFQQSLALYINTNYNVNFNLGYANNVSNTTSSVYNAGVNFQYKRFVSLFTVNQVSSALYSGLGFGINLSYTFQNSSLSTTMQQQNGQNSYTTNYQVYDPNNIWSANVGNQYTDGVQNPNSFNGGGSYNFSNAVATTNLNYSNSGNYNSVNTLGGTMIIAKNGVNLGRTTVGSFAIVDVGDLPNIGILQGDTYIGSTDLTGEFILPNLPAYYPQTIKIRQTDLPINTELDVYSKTVVPPLNGGTRVVFKVTRYTPATLKIHYGNNLTPPVGYNADLIDKNTGKVLDNLIIADDGLTVINKFNNENSYIIKMTLREGELSCNVSKDNIDQKLSNKYMLDLENVKCTLKKQ